MPGSDQSAPLDLRLERTEQAGCLGTPTPRVGWRHAAGTGPQDGYELELVRGSAAPVTVEVTGAGGAEQVVVAWPHEPLAAGEVGSVRVRTSHGDGGWSPWSAPLAFHVAPLTPEDWVARFISPRHLAGLDDPAPVLTGTVTVGPGLVGARLLLSALGVVRARINGVRVGADELTPGWTSYRKRLRFHGYDVTDLLREGSNDVDALLGNGWYRGALTWDLRRDLYGDRLALLAQVELRYADGRVETVGTDSSWRAHSSHVLSDDLYDGQHTDLRLRGTLGAADEVDELDVDPRILVAPEGPPVRITQVVPAVEIVHSPTGKQIVDFGQNLVGWVNLTVRGHAAGDRITVRHAEVLEHGELGTRPLRKAKATDTYDLAGPEETELAPQLTFHGFRYAEVTGVDELRLEDVSAAVVGSQLTRTGWFTCSEPMLEQLHENVVWGTRGNFLDVPTDCPQRDERLGWTGDIQVFARTAAFLFDVDGFLSSWLRDLAADQRPDGGVPVVVPDVLRDENVIATAWGDAATMVPWVLYRRYGDLDLLRRQLPSMRAWVDRLWAEVDDSALWRTGFQYGDWLDPTAPPEDAAAAQADPHVIQQAYLVRSTEMVAWAARALGQRALTEEYEDLADTARAAFQNAYVAPDGRVTSDCQTVYALALCWALLGSGEQVEGAGERLASLVREADATVATGFVGTPLILDALVIAGHTELAYAMLLQTQNPSWLYPVTMGATTIWERWDSMLPDGSINPGEMTSFNHYALGAVANFLHRRVAGLVAIAPGYREVEVDPLTEGPLTHAGARHLSPYGEIAVSWEKRPDGVVRLDVSVPPGVVARVYPPGVKRGSVKVGAGEHTFSG
ncbi:alpha-L-rhamnosidase [Occultella kanbiaonis]|uniref:alpha-L-rhamnosidase n=1 Tax=Occultella kanbiaonis TaxID=2675754 RepID=UPI001F472255|nr:alpha-L-rhamnosidase [Occultella kanbiaonis]